MSEVHNCKFKKINDFSGRLLKLTLVLKEKCEDKNYDIYYVCKVIDDEIIPLYVETFTPEQVDTFYNNPSYYTPDVQE